MTSWTSCQLKRTDKQLWGCENFHKWGRFLFSAFFGCEIPVQSELALSYRADEGLGFRV